jgi:succinyl-diaminopimelate desuccinylase
MLDVVKFCQDLIRIPSVSGSNDRECAALIAKTLQPLGFDTTELYFDGDGSYGVQNLFASRGEGARHLCFSGHSDVVPAGDGWTAAPFGGEIVGGSLYGRGAVDMKSSIACFICAAEQFFSTYGGVSGRVSIIISGDEEQNTTNGTPKILRWMEKASLIPDACIVGEPTSTYLFGDTVKIGRRGSLSARIKVTGKQGHVAYPENADNPISRLLEILASLRSRELDQGCAGFDRSHLEIVDINVGNETRNMIPHTAAAMLNIRYNPMHTNESLRKWITQTCLTQTNNVVISFYGDGNAFLNQADYLNEIICGAVNDVVGLKPQLSTSGGTSDARFVSQYCPTIEFGPLNTTAHQADESIPIGDIETLARLYFRFIERFFISNG